VDRFFRRGNYDPAITAELLVKAVEKNKGIVRGGFETKFADTMNRISRTFADFILRISVSFNNRWA